MLEFVDYYREPETQRNAEPFRLSMAEWQRFGCLDTWLWNCKQTSSLWLPIHYQNLRFCRYLTCMFSIMVLTLFGLDLIIFIIHNQNLSFTANFDPELRMTSFYCFQNSYGKFLRSPTFIKFRFDRFF